MYASIHLNVTEAQHAALYNIDPLQKCSDYGISLFIQAVQILYIQNNKLPYIPRRGLMTTHQSLSIGNYST